MSEQPLKRDWFYWFMAIFTVAQFPVVVPILVDIIRHPVEGDHLFQSAFFRLFSALVLVPLVVFISLLVIRRRPYNITGMLLLQWAMAIIATTVRTDEDVQVLYSLSFGWVGLWLLPIFFPDGHAFPRRFDRPIRRISAGLILSVYLWGFSTPHLGTSQALNPLFIPALAGLSPLFSTIEAVFLLVIVITILPTIAARFRGSNPRVRQQLKWLAWAFLGILVITVPVVVTGINVRDPQMLSPIEALALFLWSMLIMLAPFCAVSIAILRHNLYDIDIIIRKTLVYSLLTAILAAIYFGGVVLVQQLFRAATGQTSNLAIVISTQLIAALFSPLRRSLQATIDRRFYRRKYDAQQTLLRFGQVLRDEVEIEAPKARLAGVISETMHPATVGLWMKEE